MTWKSFLTISLFNFESLPNEDEKNVEAKNRGWENLEDWIWFLSSLIKIRLHENFHENLRRKNLTQFLRHFWLIKAKMKM